MVIKTTHTISNSISYDMGTDGKTTTSVKDANGHVNKEVTNEAGLTESTTDLGDGEEQITTAYSYDTNGNKIRETYADGGYKTFDYDRKNRLIKTETYEAGEAGESIGEKTLKTVYSYDINDRLLESIDYQIDGAEETAIRYTEYQYDSRGQTTGYAELSQENEPTADEIKAHQIRYHYDSDGKLTKVTYPTTKNRVHALSYEYDQNGRLTKTVTTDHKNDDKIKTVIYTYDKAGNRTKEDDGTTQTAYTYNGLDQLQTATKEKGTAVDEVRQYSYDANGNQTDVKNTKTGQTESYTYDAENRLSKVSVTDKDGKTAVIQQNRYNGDGQRIQKVEGSKTTNYYYQDGVVSYTTDGDNIQTSQNLIGTDGNILATQRYGSDHTDYLLYHKDIQGSTTSLVKEDGSVDATYRYTDFGETMINGDNKAENEVCYTAGIYDQSTGLYYLNARYYDPEDGRFVTEDSYRGETNEPDTQNLYVYCANNPVNYVDPSGHLFFSAGVEFTFSFVATYKNTTQITIDTHGNFTIENSRSYGIRIAWPKYSKAGFFMVGSGYIDKNKEEKRFDIGADVEVGGFSFSAGLSITNGSASAYFSGSYSPKKYSAAKGYLKILKPKEISPHAYVVCGDRMGRISISSFLKKKRIIRL
nr:RHS repeat-associated core domain-containing protein [uncultured Anaerostipes sp.]